MTEYIIVLDKLGFGGQQQNALVVMHFLNGFLLMLLTSLLEQGLPGTAINMIICCTVIVFAVSRIN
jgi:hypothetical protein